MNYPQLWRTSTLVFGLMLTGTVGVTAGTHIVRDGDSLSKIARMHGVSLGALTKANPGLNPDRIVAGAVVNLPGGATKSKAAEKAPVKSRATDKDVAVRQGGGTYKVRSGDTLTRISARTGVSVAELMRVNNLRNASGLKAGQTLLVTTAAPTRAPQRHSVDLTPPSRQTAARDDYRDAPPRESTRKPVPAKNGGITHRVRKNENFSTISQQYDVTWSALARANPGVDSTPAPGTVLNVPVVQTAMNDVSSNSRGGRLHVESDETEGVDEDVRILPRKPVSLPARRNAIRVRSTDTISGIASEFHTDERTIRELNQLGPFDKPQSKSVIYVPWPPARPGADSSNAL